MKTLVLPLLSLLALSSLASAAPAAKKKPAPAARDVAADINAPRPDARKLGFEAREGTWMSVDVSPDGRTLVFDLLGDLYAVPIAGGEARALTSGPAFDCEPRFSPDGKTIAFTSDRGGIDNLWLIDADGSHPRALTREKDAYVRGPAWTPDGTWVLARKEDGKRAGLPPVELWMYHRDGGDGVRLTSADVLNSAAGPVASPDGRFLYFAGRQRRFNYVPNLRDGLWQIYRYDRATAESLPITEGYGGAARPAISPDGKSLVYVSRRDADTVIVLRDLASGRERLLARGVTHDEEEGFAQLDLWPGYAFTPDGGSLVYSSHGKLTRLDLGSGASHEIPFVAKVEQSVAPRVAWQDGVEKGPLTARILRWPSLSPDGRQVVFDALGRIWLQDLEGGQPKGAPRRLTPDAPGLPAREYCPAFSPDGRFVAYVTWSDADGGRVWKIPAAGGTPVRLTAQAGHYANPAWSPDGSRLLIVQGSGLEFRGRQPEDESSFEIRWMDAAGGETHPVTSVETSNFHAFHPQAFWSADGTRVLHRKPVERKKPTDDPANDLVSVRLDGTDEKDLLRLPALAEMVPSPDGTWVAFTSRDNVYVAAVPETRTKEPPQATIDGGSVPVWRLSDAAGSYVAWADHGKALTWILAGTVHRLPLAEAVAFAAEQKQKAAAKGAPGAKKESEKKDEEALALPPSASFEVKLEVPRAAPEGSFLLEGARVLTMKGDEALEDADVLVTGNRIAAIGPSGSLTVPEGARRLDARGETVIPGLIDTHAHLHYSGFEIFPDAKWEYLANLAYGVTTAYDPSAPSLDVFAQAEMVEAGVMEGPRVYSSGDILYGGQQEDLWAKVDTQADALREVRRMKAYGARMIKVYQQPRRSERMYLAEACRKEHMLLTAEGAGELTTDLTMVLDGYTAFEHALPAPLHQDVVDLIAKSGTYYTPTLLVAYGGPWGELYYYQTRNPHDDPKLRRFVPHRMLDGFGRRHPWIALDEYFFPTVARGAAAVVRAGGHVSLGAHGELQGLGAHWELWAMAGEGGDPARPAMTPMEALRASTIDAADKLGLAPDLGSVEAGKLADLVVLDADPREDIHDSTRIRWVVKNGVVYDGETMKEIWPREGPAPRFFWQGE